MLFVWSTAVINHTTVYDVILYVIIDIKYQVKCGGTLVNATKALDFC